MPTKKTTKPKVKSTTAKPKSDKIHSSLQKQIIEIRDSTIALYNILEKQGITNEKEFMREYQKLSSKK